MALRGVISPATQLFVQKLIKANIKKLEGSFETYIKGMSEWL